MIAKNGMNRGAAVQAIKEAEQTLDRQRWDNQNGRGTAMRWQHAQGENAHVVAAVSVTVWSLSQPLCAACPCWSVRHKRLLL